MPIIEKIRLLHADIYSISNRLPKQHKLGIHQTSEQLARKIMGLVIEARFRIAHDKREVLETTRIRSEVLKHILRTEFEFNILTEKEYLRLAGQMIEISKMLNGWIKYVTEKGHVG